MRGAAVGLARPKVTTGRNDWPLTGEGLDEHGGSGTLSAATMMASQQSFVLDSVVQIRKNGGMVVVIISPPSALRLRSG
jgi:hypothetical protein